MDDLDKEFKQDFLTEAKELLDSTERSFLELEQQPDDSSLINNIFRFAHNLKGTSRAVGFGQIAELTHNAENLLLKLKQGEMKANERTVNALLSFNDKVKEMVEGLQQDLDKQFEIAGLVLELEQICSNKIETIENETSDGAEGTDSDSDSPEESELVDVAPPSELFEEHPESTPEASPIIDEVQLAVDYELAKNGRQNFDSDDHDFPKVAASADLAQSNKDDQVEINPDALKDLEELYGISKDAEVTAIVKADVKVEAKVDAHINAREENKILVKPAVANESTKVASKEPLKEKEKEKEKENGKEREDETIRVSLMRLEKLNDLVGELVILQSVAEQALLQSSNSKIARSLGKLCKDIQDLSMSLRMVQVGPTFQKLNRTVRDTSKLLNKKVELKIIGETTEIDKIVLEKLGDPLVHIIRNAVDHGVETPDVRLASGKNETGIVEVMAFHEGNFLVIQVTDDGKGIDPKKITQKAIEKGILSKSQTITDQQAVELVFHPGFSTKEQVSEVSGRGVGMDVVKTNIESLGGSVKIQSRPGVGSAIRMVLPLTLAIIDGMQVICGNQHLIIPRIQVHEVTKLDPARLTIMTGRTPYYRLRDEVIPVFNLSKDFSIPSKMEPEIALIVRTGKATYAVAINDVERQQQVVVKPPTTETLSTKGIMGTTILSNGSPALILDLLEIYKNKIAKESISSVKTAGAA
ncbi:MAG: chemotaxis protein CheA [Bacteriovoracaceae bacterium]|nr:chemotaxis protein CheA [Bacteriovoracaceae bacterium]